MTQESNKDENYEISEKVYKAMIEILSNPLLGEKPIYLTENHTENIVKIILYCMSSEADNWYTKNAHPKTIFYAVVINTVYEEIENLDFINNKKDFWKNLVEKLTEEEKNINTMIKEIKNNDKINIDEYHKKIKEMIRC